MGGELGCDNHGRICFSKGLAQGSPQVTAWPGCLLLGLLPSPDHSCDLGEFVQVRRTPVQAAEARDSVLGMVPFWCWRGFTGKPQGTSTLCCLVLLFLGGDPSACVWLLGCLLLQHQGNPFKAANVGNQWLSYRKQLYFYTNVLRPATSFTLSSWADAPSVCRRP